LAGLPFSLSIPEATSSILSHMPVPPGFMFANAGGYEASIAAITPQNNFLVSGFIIGRDDVYEMFVF
jgi:hypothetical protein